MNRIIIYLMFIFIFDKSSGIIHQLNDTEYKQLPVLFELDNYDSCMQDQAAIYCVASLELYGEPDNKISNLIQEYSQHSIKHYNYSKIDRGVCVTKTCRNYINVPDFKKDIEPIIEECLKDKIKDRYDLSTRLYRLNCDRYKEDDEKDSIDYIVATIFVFLCTAIIIGSWYDMKGRENREDAIIGKGEKFLQCFSLAKNIRSLNPKGEEELNDLRGLHMVRTIGQLVVVYIHSFLLLCLFIGDAHTFEKAYDILWYRIIFSLTSIVQVFFIISGFLLTYTLEIYAENGQISWRNVPRLLFQRWWRLTPSIAFVLGVTMSWFRYLGSGPLWKYFVTNGISTQCRQYFWAHIFFLNNFIKDDVCSYQSWHVAADIQLFVPCLIVHFAIRNRSLRCKIGVLSLLFLIGIVGPIGHVWLQDLHTTLLLTPEVYRSLQDDTFKKYHMLPHNNLTGFVIGMTIGYLAYYLKKKKMEFPNFMIGSILCWLAIPMYIGVFYVVNLSYIDVDGPSRMFLILFAGFHRPFIGLIGSVWILGIILKFNDCSKALMEWRWWMVPSKLSYGVYLVHSEVINYLLGSKIQVHYFSYTNIFVAYIGIVFVSYALAFVLYLLVEAPAKQLIRVLVSDVKLSKIKAKDI